MLRTARFQICRFDMISEYNALKRTPCWKRNFERMASKSIFEDHRIEVCESQSPDLVASGFPPIGLAVAILSSNSGNQILQRALN